MAYSSFLTRDDLLLVTAVVAFAVVSGVIFSPITDHGTLEVVDRFTNVLILAMLLAMLVPLIRASRHWGGEIGRNLQIVALGLVFFMVSIVPHVEWHVRGAPGPLGPAMMGLSPAWWAGFFHVLTIVSWVVMIYGFYRFWQLARPKTVNDR